MMKSYILIAMLLLVTIGADAQQEIWVDKFTGTASVTIPLYTVASDGVSIPFALSYTASGVKVADAGGLAGLNWSLQGGISIHREVRGLPDDIQQQTSTGLNKVGWLRSAMPAQLVNAVSLPPTSSAACSSQESSAVSQLMAFEASNTLYDSEPDVFSYHLPGHSGKFTLELDGVTGATKARLFPYDPITITVTYSGTDGKLATILVKTPEGASYNFTYQQKVTESWRVMQATSDYWLHQYAGFQEGLTYATDFLVGSVTTVAGNVISFNYQSQSPTPSKRRINYATGALPVPAPIGEYEIATSSQRLLLTKVTSPTDVLSFSLVDYGYSDTFLAAVDISSRLPTAPAPATLQRFTFDYLNVRHENFVNRPWYNASGATIGDNPDTRRFLAAIHLYSCCAELPGYAFTYDKVAVDNSSQAAHTSALPPTGSAEQDYWGFYNGNKAATLIPRIYVATSTSTLNAQTLANFPYRLYPVAGSVGELPGADRRPTTDPSIAVAGTLVSVKVPTGGLINLTYEGHQAYDPKFQQTVPVGGLRLKTLEFKDLQTGATQQKTYEYLDISNSSSGRLLTLPQYAFAVPAPLPATPTLNDWAGATVRTEEEVAQDPFESRVIGYSRVTEKVSGRGRMVFTYSLPATAEDLADGTTWQRTRVGLARATAAGVCPVVDPVTAGYERYPFVPSTNYDFQRGTLLKTQTYAENGTSPLQEENYTYELMSLQPTWAGVSGVAYEKLKGKQAYAYGKYKLLTEYLLVLKQQSLKVYDGITPLTTTTAYSYNSNGQLITTRKVNSDGIIYRTRQKYLADYNLPDPTTGSTYGPVLGAMYARKKNEGISTDLVESISEVIGADKVRRVVGLSLGTYTSLGSRTRPYQAYGWQTAQGVVLGTDTTRVATANSVTELTRSSRLLLQSSVEETTTAGQPLTVSATSGRQLSALHLGYAPTGGNATLPVLQLQNAKASQVLFSNFEAAKDFSFPVSNPAFLTAVEKHTGLYGYTLNSTSPLSGQLTSLTTARYRLACWMRNATTTAATVRVQVIAPAGTVLTTQDIPVAAGAPWQLLERELNLGGALPTGTYTVSIKLNAGSSVVLDDVLFLPSGAQASSITYDPTRGKTSTIDNRGLTRFYDYDPAGRLAAVKAADNSILSYTEQIIAGVKADVKPAIATTGNLYDGTSITLTASLACLPAGAVYNWDFGDGTTSLNNATNTISHTYSTQAQDKLFYLTLTVKSSAGDFSNRIPLTIRSQPIELQYCLNGVVGYDMCKTLANQLYNSCGTATTPTTQLDITLTATGSSFAYTYQWQQAEATSNYAVWSPAANAVNGPTYFIYKDDRNKYRCVVSSKNASGTSIQAVSETFYIADISNTTCPTR